MILTERKNAFVQLGKVLQLFSENAPWSGLSLGITQSEFDEFNEAILKSKIHNGWFTEENVRKALGGIASMVSNSQLDTWLANYELIEKPAKKVGVIMAGNIPFVGFHDMLCVLISGNTLVAKLSSEDTILMQALTNLLLTLEPRFKENIRFVHKLEDFDTVIATGSNNSARYFESYFEKYPHIIRKNRTSIGIFYGEETKEELDAFADDVFLYFGMGCRNVTKIFVPKGFDLDRLFEAFYKYKEVIHHNKYANNYDYHKAIYLMNKIELLENGFLLLKEDESLHSPLSVLHYEYYEDKEDLHTKMRNYREAIQCVVGKGHIPFGKAQKPNVWNYADNVDTLAFLQSLN